MKDEIQKLMDEYILWLKDKTILRDLNGGWTEITTPHLDRHNDALQIYIRKHENGYLLTDDAYTLTDLANSGCPIDTPKRQELLNMAIRGFGVELDGQQLITHATKENFALKKHSFIQAMLAVDDLFYLSSPYVAGIFYEDVVKWLDNAEIRYTSKIKLSGKSGYDHMFDFVIPKSRKEPERVIQTLNNPKKDSAEALIFKWEDTRETRIEHSTLYAFLNDENVIAQSVIDALRNYKVVPVLWSESEKYREKLAA